MALNNKKDRTITYLKATFFDLFKEHTKDAVKMIESLANGQSEDAVKIETAIFQRIILLNKTANSIDDLQKNVESLEVLKVNDAVKEIKPAVNTPVNQVVSPVKPSVEIGENTSLTVPSREAVKTPASTSSVTKTPTNQVRETSTTSSVESAPSVNSQVPIANSEQKIDVVVESKSAPLGKKEEAATKVSEPEAISNVVENKATLVKPTKLIKKSDKRVKAILVTSKQYNKLRASRDRQFGLLNFGVSSNEATATRIERLMREASSLYKSGEVSKAQALYSEISALNKKLNQEQGNDKVLLKKVA